MSLTPKRKMTEKNLAAHRRNGPKSRGAVTPQGKARAAQANLRHGFYAPAEGEVLIALGEDPAEYQRMVESLQSNLPEALETLVVGRIGRTLWRMRRAERMQDGLALKRVRRGSQMEELEAGTRFTDVNAVYERLCAIARTLNSTDSTPSPAEIEALVAAFGKHPPDEVKKMFPLFQAFGEAARNVPQPSDGGDIEDPAATQEMKAARENLEAVLNPLTTHYAMTQGLLMDALENIRSPGNRAALMAPEDQNAVLVQRMEDSSMRQLWRLTSILIKLRKGALSLTDSED